MENIGLSTKEALGILYSEIKKLLETYEHKFQNERLINKARSPLQKRYNSPVGWFSIFSTFLCIICLFIIKENFAALLILIVLLINIFLVIRENNLRRTEVYRKVRSVLNEIKLAEKELCEDWESCNYPHLSSPLSPCISLQWTYRDNEVINLPWALLVRNDHIVVRPGQAAPGQCSEINGKKKFKAGEIYGLTHRLQPSIKPIARSPLPDLICILEKTPYLENLKTILDQFLNRPPTIYNQQRYLLITKYLQQWGFVVAMILVLLAGTLRKLDKGFSSTLSVSSKDIFIEATVAAVIPLLPLLFPLMWISVNLWGVAKLGTFLMQPQLNIMNEKEKKFEENLDTQTFDTEYIYLPNRDIFHNWMALWNGSSDLLGRSSNVCQVLGSITTLCCVDKKGILSWPNPTAEKVFFFRESINELSDISKSSMDSEVANNQNPKSNIVAEVLDLTHDQHSPFKLEFDDHKWKNYLSSLKPIGLGILLNTCNSFTHASYARLCGHVTAVAMPDKDLIPVTNRYEIVESGQVCLLHGRCLCELAKQIGFTSSATSNFVFQGQLASYRHLQPEVVRHDIRFARQFQISSKVKVPFPHSLSVMWISKEYPHNSISLFTQGTGDIILESCQDFFDGKTLKPFTLQEKKKALDFYQRSSLTAYCTAFSYTPIRKKIIGPLGSTINKKTAFLELPPEIKCKTNPSDKIYDPTTYTKLSRSLSTDSLLFINFNIDETDTTVKDCFEMQNEQIFLGMVNMQYQPQNDIVQLIESLERACIRFVHFSKENELRSRVFSEKLGLESGWNCHISLLSEEINSNQQSPKKSTILEIEQNIDLSEDENVNETISLIPPINLERGRSLSVSAPGTFLNQNKNFSIFDKKNSTSNISLESINELKSKNNIFDENNHSLSILTDSTEQSAPVHFDMSNRAKLPKGIENIRPHLEMVDNVPLQVSLFTDCCAEATKEMLSIMQSYGEIVVCIGSSASNSNAETFLQGDCSIAVEPLYPQVCQKIPAYTETNLLNNKMRLTRSKNNFQDGQILTQTNSNTVMISRSSTMSPIYLSRILNSIPCSISICRDDNFSILKMIELSRKFSSGLWNCIQFWACSGCTLVFLNIISACFSLPPILTPKILIYLTCIVIPIISLTLTNVDNDLEIMNRATGKKQTKYNTKVFGFVIWCYGCKFLPTILFVIFSYIGFIGEPFNVFKLTENPNTERLEFARMFSLLGIVIHFIMVSVTFVHRDHCIFVKSPFTNKIWSISCTILLVFHSSIILLQIILNNKMYEEILILWPPVIILILTAIISLIIAEICKFEEIKTNSRYQRRARLDFGTKLGMNSPF